MLVRALTASSGGSSIMEAITAAGLLREGMKMVEHVLGGASRGKQVRSWRQGITSRDLRSGGGSIIKGAEVNKSER
jgi:hypothetical protein